MQTITTIGLDIAKSVFQAPGFDLRQAQGIQRKSAADNEVPRKQTAA